MQFVNSMTRTPGEVRKVYELWRNCGEHRNPFSHVLFTPISSSKGQLHSFRALVDGTGAQVTFDSGGFYVQIGRLSYDALYGTLLDVYSTHRWADWYVLPDWVPVSSDSYDAVWDKIRHTVRTCSLFMRELPTEVRCRAIGVVHGRTREQLEYCLDAYCRMGVAKIGFGSFGTSGPGGSINCLSASGVKLLADLSALATGLQLQLHTFGIGSPSSLAVFKVVGIQSFDSVSWMKTAGFGNIHFPFSGPLNVTYRDYGARSLTRSQFEELKNLTHHECPFCQSFDNLRQSRDYRMMHNLIALLDTLDQLNNASEWESILALLSPRHAKLLLKG